MIGAIIGDVVGSKYEFNNYLSKRFPLFDDKNCCFTDDTVMTCAVAYALMKAENDEQRKDGKFIADCFHEVGRLYPNCGYGRKFFDWMLRSKNPQPYNSCGNGSAMRISPVGFWAKSEEEVKELSRAYTEVTHNHPEGIKGAECTAMCIYLARVGKSKKEIMDYVYEHYYPVIASCDDYRKDNAGEHGKEICQVTVPQALACFYEGDNYEDVIRNCVSIGGDTDTIGAIAGGIAEAYYGVPEYFKYRVCDFLDEILGQIVTDFEITAKWPSWERAV